MRLSTVCVPILVAFIMHQGLCWSEDSQGERTVWLDELDVRLSTSGLNRTQQRKSIEGNPLRIDGREFEHGIGTHAESRFRIDLGGGSQSFAALVAVDDEAGRRGSVEFKVIADGKEIWTSGLLRRNDPAKKVEVDVSGVRKLDLVVTDGGNGYESDHADWADAKFIVIGKQPVAVETTGMLLFERMGKEIDLFKNDGGFRDQQKRVAPQTLRPDSLLYETDRDQVDVLLRRTKALLQHLMSMPNVRDLSKDQLELEEISGENQRIPIEDRDARERLFGSLADLRRRIALSNPLLDFKDILFIKRQFNPPDERQGNHMCDQYFGFNAIPEGGLYVLEDAFSDAPRLRDVLADSVCENGRFTGRKLEKGGFLSPDLSYNGKNILFAFTEAVPPRYEWTEKNTFHVFAVGVDGTGLRQLTDGTWNDFDPCWMPNGRIVFISERRGGYGRCHGRPVPIFTLHTMNDDGSDIVRISHHESNEWHPSVDSNGMIVYTRWDYVDRGFNQAHHPWITTPDGRDARAIQGNYGREHNLRPQMEMEVRAIPGSYRYIATATQHHGQAYGSLIIVDPQVEDDDAMAPLKRITPEVLFPEAETSNHLGKVYATPWPLSEDFYLCVYDPDGRAERGPDNRYGIYLVDSFGNKELIYRDPAISCLSPIPVRPTKVPPVVPPASFAGGATIVKSEQEEPGTPQTGIVGLVNVYNSLKPFPENTTIKALRIIQVLPKTTPYADNPRIGFGTNKNARAVLGTVPVELDGSAHFELPAGMPVYFQALDEKGLAVQSMKTDVYVQPGEKLVCQGCHEPRHKSPQLPDSYPTALTRSASVVAPDVEGSNPFNFIRLVQPVLDRNCVACHAKEDKAPKLDIGEPERNNNNWSSSYINLERFTYVIYGNVWTEPRTIPGQFGARASGLYRMLKDGHHDVQLSDEDLHRVTLWLDCNSDFFGTYENIQAQARGEMIRPTLN